jgi:acetyl esterase/lipase
MKSLMLLTLLLVADAADLRDIPYVADADPLQKLDLHLPEAAKTLQPVVVAIHGGGWAIGDKKNHSFVQPKTDWFNDHGFIVASVNYRLSPAVKHPVHIEDVCQAIAWIQKHIGKHGGDPNQLYLLGHSAGAHLAALAAVDQKRLKAAGVDPGGIRGAILIDGAAYDVPKQMRTGTPLARKEGMYANAFTLDPDTQKDASPALQVTVKPPPFLILHVKHRADSATQAGTLQRALEAKGGSVTVVPVYGKTHMTINRDFGRIGDPTTKAAATFLGLPQTAKPPREKLHNGPASK